MPNPLPIAYRILFRQSRPLEFLPCRGRGSSLAGEAGTALALLPWQSLSSQSRSGRRARPRLATDSATACVPARLSSIASPSGRLARRTCGSATWPSGRWRCCWSRPRATKSPAACSRPKSGGRTRRSMARCQTLPPFTLCPYPHAPHPHPTTPRQVWRVRAVRPGHVGDRRLMLEHRVGAVPVRECGCPQPPFVDCKKPPFMAKRWTIPDPVVRVRVRIRVRVLGLGLGLTLALALALT